VALGLVTSKGEAKRMIKGGGARVDGQQITDENHVILISDQSLRVSAGKKSHGLLT